MVLLLWFLCFLCFCLYTIARNDYFPAFLEVFCLFCSHKRPVLNCFFSSHFVFFAFVFPFKNPFSSLRFVHQPLFKKRLFVGFLLFFFCLPFPFLMFACLFETNFPNIPFCYPSCFHYWQFICFFCCSCVCFHGVCFSLYASMLALFLVFCCFHLCFCFCLVACFAFNLWKTLFSLQFWCFCWVMLLKRVVCFYAFMFLFLFVFLVLFVSIYRIHLYYFVSMLLFLSQD